uniref:Nucleolar protein 10 n=1 Tax=Anthurium amnicola TaxID=1678845 RepID=A0A1D1XHZ7_9ARAE
MTSRCDGLKVLSHNGVKIYCITGHRYGDSPIPTKKLKSLRQDEEFKRRLDVIQDLKFETATSRIKVTPDGGYVIASGIYPPQVKVYDLNNMALKFERHLTSEIINFQVLDEDYSKIAFLCADRSVCLHAKYGSHYSLRIPRMGRDIAYDCWSCDLLCAASSPDIYRINLEQGRFLSSLSTQAAAINAVSRSTVHGLLACGGEDGTVECFDLRTKSSVGRINTCFPAGGSDEVTALQFDDESGFHMAVGSSSGKILIYDLRLSNPIKEKDHKNDSPIVNLKWHQTVNSVKPKLISADTHVVNIWDPDTGDNLTSIQPPGGGNGGINDVCIFPGSGLMLLALDRSQIPSYFIPALGPAPKWIENLDKTVEEEEIAETIIYEHFKFVTEEELERLNLGHLKSSNLVKPELHGYFIDLELYKKCYLKARALADPFEYEDYIEKKKQEKLEAERASRITIRRKLPKVNRLYAASILENQETDEAEADRGDNSDKKRKLKKRKLVCSELLKDERFAAMFEDKDFEVDENSEEYLSRYAHSSKEKKQPFLIEEHFEPVLEDDEEQGLSDSDGSRASKSSEDTFNGSKVNLNKGNARIPRLYEVKDERHAEAFMNSVSLAEEDALPLGERGAALQKRHASGVHGDVKLGPGGSREITFLTRNSIKGKAAKGEEQEGKRRGIQSLGLKSDRSHFHSKGWRGGKRGRGRGRGQRKR